GTCASRVDSARRNRKAPSCSPHLLMFGANIQQAAVWQETAASGSSSPPYGPVRPSKTFFSACCASQKRSYRNLLMRFCPQFGAPLLAAAKFCVECGRGLEGGASGAGNSGTGLMRRTMPVTTAFALVFVAITVAGLGAAAWIMMRTPDVVRQQVANSAPSNPISVDQAPGSTSSQQTASNSSAGSQPNGELPPGHPKVELPTEARTFIDKIEREARSR